MPSPRSAPADPDRLSVAVDATPLLGRPTGVGAFCAGALAGLAARPDLRVDAFAVSWRRHQGIVGRVPEGVGTAQRAMPARPLHLGWRHLGWPPVEWFAGRHDVVHGTNFVVPPASGAGRVVTVHDLTVVRFPELCDQATLAFPAQVRRAVDRGAWVHTPSAFVAAEVVEAFGADPSRVRAVHHGVPALPVPDVGCDPGPGGPGFPLELPRGMGRYVLAIGTVEPRKDYPSLVAAFESIASAHADVALVVVGSDGWGADRFRAAMAASPVRSRIVRAGYLPDAALGPVLRHAAVLAYPSVYEGFGFPPVQAMASGVPVVATAVGAVPEVVGDGALLVEQGDADALAGGIDQVLGGGGEVDGLVARGRHRSEAFTWQACAEGLASLYRDARAGAPGSGRGTAGVVGP